MPDVPGDDFLRCNSIFSYLCKREMNEEQLNISIAGRGRGERRCTMVGMAADAVLSVAKIATGIVAGSAAMVADGVHSVSDLAVDTVVMTMVSVSGRGVDANYRYGHGKFGTLATVFIAVVLVVVGLGLLIDGGTDVWGAMHGVALERPGSIALVVLAVAIVAKEALYRYTMWRSRSLDSTTLRAYAWHHRGDALSSLGTLVGIAGAVYLGEGWQVLDPLTAMCVSVLILGLSYRLGRPAVEELLEISLPSREVALVEQAIGAAPGVRAFHNLRTRRNGSVRVVDVHIKVDGEMTVTHAHDITQDVEQRLREALGEVITYIHVEPFRGTNCCEQHQHQEHAKD